MLSHDNNNAFAYHGTLRNGRAPSEHTESTNGGLHSRLLVGFTVQSSAD
jgi:hypothetical protein